MYGRSNSALIHQVHMPSATRTSLLHSGLSSGRARPQIQGVGRERLLHRNTVSASALLEVPESVTATIGSAERVKRCRLITAIKTPYLETGRIDLKAYDTLVCHQIRNGVEGLIIGGTTGEGQLMSWDEHIMLIAHTVNSFGKSLAVIGNTGSNATREAIHATEQGFSVGMDAALQINPYYGKTSEDGMYKHFEYVLNEGPGILYNVPGRTGQDIPMHVVETLADHPGFLGIKECEGNFRISHYAEQGITCWSGNDDQAHDCRHYKGGQGVISVTSNLIPGLFSKLMQEEDEDLNDNLQELIAWLFCEPNPIGINTALAMCGLIKPIFRLPYVPLDREQREHGARLMTAVIEHIPGAKRIEVMEDEDFQIVPRY